ncbi:MAG: Phosphopentomutase [Ktedonobacterales bacterium]|jgi:phosphopentomutase|nr:MAG: Phosphopentomutase [Ktedonobacterales bacterium]
MYRQRLAGLPPGRRRYRYALSIDGSDSEEEEYMAAIERAVVLVLDGVGVGQAPDAARYGDAGANCLTNTANAVGALRLPVMGSMGLGNLTPIAGTPPTANAIGAYARLDEAAAGKDSTTGHWELMGVTLHQPLPTYPHGFPADLVARFEAAIGRGTLGNKPASGTVIIEELGAEHIRTGKPILYTSGDSVFQLAAHEQVIPLDDLYHMCEIARGMLTGEHAVGRVIARPFIGEPGAFTRTPHRRDFSLLPPAPTLLDLLVEAGYQVIGIGKIEDLFAFRGLTKSNHTGTNEAGMAAALDELTLPFRGLLFVNLVDCDQVYGHRRNPQGYAHALEDVDAWLPRVLDMLGPRDALFITGDHGTDPTYTGTDHTREAVPMLAAGGPITPNVNLGVRASFADLGATLAEAFGVGPLESGSSFARAIGLA